MAIFNLNINGKQHSVDVAADTPILWVLRDTLGLVGTKYGCGIAMCGARTIHQDGNAIRATQLWRIVSRPHPQHLLAISDDERGA